MTDVLERRLGALAGQIPCPPAQPFADEVLRRVSSASTPLRRPATRPIRRRFTIAMAVAAVVGSVMVLPGPRGVVARWFGFDSVRIQPGPLPTPTAVGGGSMPELGAGVSAADAKRVSGLPLPTPAVLGEPTSIHVVDSEGIVQVVAVYPSGSTSPKSPGSEVGALVSVFAAHLDRGYFSKFLDEATTMDVFTIDGSAAIWLEGAPHQIVVVVDDEVLVDTLRLATNTLLWERDGIVLRIEAEITRDEAVRIAVSWEPTTG